MPRMPSSFHGARLALSCAALACACAAAPARAVTLYDPALGTTPSAQGWLLGAGSAPGSQSVVGGRYRLDTTGAGVSSYGNALFTPLDVAAGFDLGFTLQLTSETHESANRAGYSVLVVGSDPKRSIEIGFWTDHVWVYDRVDAAIDPDRMIHGGDAAFDTAASAHAYLLSVRNGQFTLRADGNPLLAGALRDYSAEGGPYSLANLLVFSDDTTRGTSITLLGAVTITAVPEPAAAVQLLAGLAGLAALSTLRARQRRGAAA